VQAWLPHLTPYFHLSYTLVRAMGVRNYCSRSGGDGRTDSNYNKTKQEEEEEEKAARCSARTAAVLVVQLGLCS
jgi:hypothetical protein